MPMRDSVSDVDVDTMIAEEEKQIYKTLTNLALDLVILNGITNTINRFIRIDKIFDIINQDEDYLKCIDNKCDNNTLQIFTKILSTHRLAYQGMRRFKIWNSVELNKSIQDIITSSDGGQHPEVALYINISVVYALICDMQAMMEKELVDEKFYQLRMAIRKLRSDYDRFRTKVESEFCKMLNISIFDEFIEHKIGSVIDDIYFNQLDKIKSNAKYSFA